MPFRQRPAPLARLALISRLIAFRGWLVPEHEPGVSGRCQHPHDGRPDDPEPFYVFGTGGQLLWVNPRVGQPPALWYSERAQLTVTRTMTQRAHRCPEPEPAPAPDLLDGLPAGELLAGDRHMQVTVIGPVTGDVRKHQAASSDWEPSDWPEGCPFRDRLRRLAAARQWHRSHAARQQALLRLGG